MPDRLGDACLQIGQVVRELLRHGRQGLAIDEDAGDLHSGQDRQERHLDLAEQVAQTHFVEL
jgi:hypothetical protein